MNCTAVRDRLTEEALGALSSRDAASMERHLAWCAARRRESEDLHRAAATFGLTLAPASPPPDLEDRVVDAVRAAAGRPRGPARRGARTAAALVVAAMVAISGLGWGAVMAGRADRFKHRAAAVAAERQQMINRIADFLVTPPFVDPSNKVYLGTLAPTSGVGGGAALTLTSPSILDMAVVTVAGLPPTRSSSLPYKVTLVDPAGDVATVGRVTGLDADGGATIVKNFNRDLLGFTDVVVTDAGGHVVMRGTMEPRGNTASPTP